MAEADKRSSRSKPRRGKGSKDPGELIAGTEVRTGLIRGNTFHHKPVTYLVRDGLALFEGDIVLGTEEEMEQLTSELQQEASGGLAAAAVITGAQFRWPNCTVPFTIDPALPDQARVTDAIAHWQSRTGYRFVARTNEADFVTFRPASGCSSSVGRRGGQQFVNLGPSCSLGNVIHEIGHTIGLWHEQSREDRDAFVTINFTKIEPGMESNFAQHIVDGDDVGAYDYGSIMHYPRDAFSVDGSDTITPVDPTASIGQRDALSAGDIAAANSLCPTQKLPFRDPPHTFKERVKDVILDTRKEATFDTFKEPPKDTGKLPVFDPPKRLDPLVTPGPLVSPEVGPAGLGGRLPFTVAMPPQAPGLAAAPPDAVDQQVQELDAILQALAAQLTQLDEQRMAVYAQYQALLAQLQQLLAVHGQLPPPGM